MRPAQGHPAEGWWLSCASAPSEHSIKLFLPNTIVLPSRFCAWLTCAFSLALSEWSILDSQSILKWHRVSLLLFITFSHSLLYKGDEREKVSSASETRWELALRPIKGPGSTIWPLCPCVFPCSSAQLPSTPLLCFSFLKMEHLSKISIRLTNIIVSKSEGHWPFLFHPVLPLPWGTPPSIWPAFPAHHTGHSFSFTPYQAV